MLYNHIIITQIWVDIQNTIILVYYIALHG